MNTLRLHSRQKLAICGEQSSSICPIVVFVGNLGNEKSPVGGNIMVLRIICETAFGKIPIAIKH